MHKYEIIIYWSDEDKAVIAEVPELPGCAAHGKSPDTALIRCNEAINLWIDTAKELLQFAIKMTLCYILVMEVKHGEKNSDQ